ncbi:hypothetical protein DESPIG_02509 [Desulfovibrio piger ATCC 29098]|uniref:Uncharacterized protein n=1 Tax=Desulfovibrio piger ATCC 29098 TaxID=411464 RepID=B6WWP0_9BACT|nr:hypothetical protein DESPIG_02509 [Desulfovibrio piger ATCC 29098]
MGRQFARQRGLPPALSIPPSHWRILSGRTGAQHPWKAAYACLSPVCESSAPVLPSCSWRRRSRAIKKFVGTFN